MNEAVDQLTHVLPLPPSGQSKDWDAVSREVGTELPADYKQFIETFGGGYVDRHLWVLEPGCANEHYDLVTGVKNGDEALEDLWELEEKPQELANGGRLIVWATTDNGEVGYWLARPGQSPDEWTVMVNDESGTVWEHFDMGLARFLLSTLTGSVISGILSYTYPKDPHSFEPSGDFV